MPRRRFGMAALSYGAMDPLAAPGLARLPAPAVPPPDRAAEPAGFVVLSDDGAARLHFLDWDRGSAEAPSRGRDREVPGVLLLHGLAETAWCWAPVARRLRRMARVVAADLRGHGLSDAPTHGYDPADLAADAIAVAEGAGLLAPPGDATPGPLVVAGLGYGAAVAAVAARALGPRCAGLVLVDGGWEHLATATDATPDEWLALIEEPPEVLASMAAWLADRAAFDPATWDQDAERAARAQVVETAAGRLKLAVHPHALAASVRALWAYDPAAVLPGVEARVAALVARDPDGARRAALRDVATARLAAGRGPVAAAAFPDRGHNLVRHEPDAVAAAVLAAVSATMSP
jgi:pimeloyl-ACP methyl ester carboxylesterase